jgi:hypothetical protein
MHALLFVSAVHHALIAGSSHFKAADYYYHKGEAIRLIKRQLVDQGDSIVESIIAAIAVLVAYIVCDCCVSTSCLVSLYFSAKIGIINVIDTMTLTAL